MNNIFRKCSKNVLGHSLAVALLASTAHMASAQAQAKDQWRLGVGQVNTPYTNAQNAAVGPASNPLVELGWSREIAGPWSVRAGFLRAAESHRLTQRSTVFVGGRTQLTDIDSSNEANVYQLGLGLMLTEGQWGRLTASTMLTHTRAAIGAVVTDTYQGGGQPTQQSVESRRVRGTMNRMTLGLEYQLPAMEAIAGLAPYLQVQKFMSANGEGGKQTFITAGVIKTF